MQLLPPLTRDPKVIAREQPVGRHLPYARHVDDHTIETRDGLLLQVIHLRGLLFETADTDEINYRKRLRDAMLQAIGSSRFALYHHIVRRRVEADLPAEHEDRFSRELDEAWAARLAARQLYVNDLYLTLVRRPLQGRVGILDRIRGALGRAAEAPGASTGYELRQLGAARDALVAALGNYQPRLLGVRDTEHGICSEPLEFLSTLLNAESRPVLLPNQDLGDYLPYRRISFGQESVELGRTGTAPRAFQGIVSIKDYPGQTQAGMLDDLLRLPFELTISQSFGFVDRQAALSGMNLALRRMRSAEDEAVSLRADLSRAKDDVAAGRAAFGEHHLTIAVHADTPDGVDDGVAEILAALGDLGIIAVREEIALEPAFWAQFPGNFKYIARKGLVSTANFAGLASGHNFPIGRPSDNHWGDAVTLLETTAAGPYFFNFHQGDLGNFTVIGPSGSGKTVVLNFLLAQARKFRPRIIFFDKDRGAELFIRAIGGRYDLLRPGTPSGLNPLQIEDSHANRQFLIGWLAVLAGGADVDEMAQIKDAVDANFAQPAAHRRLRNIAELFRGGHRAHSADLWARLRPWWGEGERAWLFDNAQDLTDLTAASVGFDMTQILDDPAVRTPAMMYLFHRVEERLDGSPAIIVVDEGWKALDDEVFVRRIKDWEKTIRKRNGIVGFATQSAQDALESRIASAIIEQAATQIFMANPKARESDYVEGFGLTPHEYEIVRTLPDSSHSFLIKHGTDSVVVRLDLSGERQLLTILSGRERTVRILDEVRAETGDDPEAWIPRLLERV
ncbi:VirB4 family type IV secretion/conjugal transfer ATPase [Sphingosinicella sp. BN140058]|uniref:VirB4 family type IV secretion/conjugal transfer ATPase n=1 Tax=Sphingosinicella sp. BN140058 TaxID=1892855 RepID=UPI001012BE50|nr:VirB4 family type IV secretion/conjugal transfer ATPase [Sphingosinicella sp. BN140058]QAY78057.1 VirB4 family type IV secretion/conjugal transfer ATPase [Sphingosinicella sp. BN140058]